jgi:hypothetical protein
MRAFLPVAAIALVASACGAPAIKYMPNSQALVEQMYKASTDFAREIPLTSASRVAIVNLEGRMTEASSPSVPIYDMLVIALSKRKIPVVERDAEALYASVLESWSSRLPFRVSSPCGKLCPATPVAPAAAVSAPALAPTIIVQGCSTSCGSDAAPGECKACNQPTLAAPAKDLVDIVQELARLRQEAEVKEAETSNASAASGPGDVNAVPTGARTYRDLFSEVILPGWFAADGSRIVANQASATHVLAYRALTYGTAVFKTMSDKTIRREVRIDLILRLIRVDEGVVEWSDRVSHRFEEQLPAEVQGALGDNPFAFSPSQYGPGEP